MAVRPPNQIRQLVLLVLLLLASPAAAAEGVNLAWNHCLGEGTGVQNVTFACNTNVGSHVMTGSFLLGVNMADIIGLEIVVDLASASARLPSWWTFQYSGSCRMMSLTANFVPDPSDAVCVDWALGQAVGGFAFLDCASAAACGSRGPNAARIKVGDAVPQEASQNLTAGTEYFAFNLSINNAKTVGAGSCECCQTPVCIVLNSIDVVGKGNIGSRKLTTPTGPGSNFIAWQGGGVPVVGAAVGCPAATPTRHSTWGAVKALYR